MTVERVLIIVGSVSPVYGVASVVRTLDAGLQSLGTSTVILTHDRPAHTADFENATHLQRRNGIIGWTLFILQLRRYIARLDTSVEQIISFETMTNFAVRAATWRTKHERLVVFTEHGEQSKSLPRLGITGKITLRLMPFFYAGTSIVAVSEAVKRDLIRRCHVRGGLIHVVPNPVDAEAIVSNSRSELSVTLGPIRGNPYVISVASLNSSKGHEDLLRALSQTMSDIDLVLAGDGPLRSHLEELARELNIRDRVHFLGHVENPASLVKNARASVLLSRNEGFGISVVEAAILGTLPISSDAGGLAEVTARCGGIVLRLEDPGFVSSVARAIDDASGGGAFEPDSDWLARLSPSSVAEKYSNILGGHGGSS